MRQKFWLVMLVVGVTSGPAVLGCGDGKGGGETCGDGVCEEGESVGSCPQDCVRCGNDAVDEGEDCDGSNLGGETCLTQGADGGELSCTDSCSFDLSGCCTDSCDNEGDTQCSGETLESCSLAADGCLEWIEQEICTENGEVCVVSDGTAACVAQCTDGCPAAGDSRCNETTIQTCSVGASDGCLHWTDGTDCDDTGDICDDTSGDAICLNSCSNACPDIGDLQCNADTIEECQANATDGCFDWVQIEDCTADQNSCNDTTGTPHCCSDECPGAGDLQCNADTIEECQQSETDGCFDWILIEDCAENSDSCRDTTGTPSCCSDECPLVGETRCSADTTVIEVCGAGPAGCSVWQLAQACEVDEVCEFDGNAHACVPDIYYDSDGDGVPDAVDPYPDDPSFPTTALPDTVYPHTASALFTMSTSTYAIDSVGSFWGSTYSGSMTDMAIDRWGVLYGVTFGELFVCDAANAECRQLATLPQAFNGLTMVPPGTLDPDFDVLVAIANSGDWYRVDFTGPGAAGFTLIGSYGAPYTSSGDAFSIEGVGTYASVDKVGESSDYIVSVDPMTGSVISEVGPVTGYSGLFGLAGCLGEVYGFDSYGAIIRIDLGTGVPTLIAQTANSWWGAAVSTRL